MAGEAHHRPCVGVPWRSLREEDAGRHEKIEPYLRAVEAAGGKPELISLRLPLAELKRLARALDAVVLPGSGADVNPSRYGEKPHGKCAPADPERERTDCALLDHAFVARKPVLAICYGTQLLNVYLGGGLIQHIPSELLEPLKHDWADRDTGAPEPFHTARLETGSALARLAGATEVRVNSSHHQAIRVPGRDLRVTARAPDGVVEAVEWTGNGNWVLGVQWHPERLWPRLSEGQTGKKANYLLSEALFGALLAAARGVAVRG